MGLLARARGGARADAGVPGRRDAADRAAAARRSCPSPTPSWSGAGNYWQNTDFYNTQFKVLRSKGLGEKVVDAAQAHRPRALQVVDRPGVAVHEPRGRRARAREPAGAGDASPTATRARRRSGPTRSATSTSSSRSRRASSRRARRYGVAAGAPRRDPAGHARRAGPPLPELPDPGPLRARGQRVRGQHLDRQAATRTSSRRRRGASRSRRRSSRRAEMQQRPARSSTRCPRSRPTPSSPASTRRSRRSRSSSGGSARSTRRATPRSRRSRRSSSSSRRRARRAPRQILDGARRRVHAAPEARGGAARRDRRRRRSQAANQSRKVDRARGAQEGGGLAKSLYEVLLQKLNETDIAASIRSNNVTVVDRASAAAVPGAPAEAQDRARRPRCSGSLAGLGLVLARDYLANTIRDPEEIERYLHLDLLAAVPRYDQEQRLARDRGLPEPAHRAHLRAPRRARPGGARHRHGAPGGQDHDDREPRAAARRLGRADGGRRLRPAARAAAPAARRCRASRASPTPSCARSRVASLAARDARSPNLFALTAGPLPPNPPALLARKQLAGRCSPSCRREFEWVLVDSPPARLGDRRAAARRATPTTRCSWCSTTRSTRSWSSAAWPRCAR